MSDMIVGTALSIYSESPNNTNTIPTNAYVVESGSTNYVAEDGTTPYVTE